MIQRRRGRRANPAGASRDAPQMALRLDARTEAALSLLCNQTGGTASSVIKRVAVSEAERVFGADAVDRLTASISAQRFSRAGR